MGIDPINPSNHPGPVSEDGVFKENKLFLLLLYSVLCTVESLSLLYILFVS